MDGSRGHLVDELLVMRCQDGEAAALRQLVDRWQRPLWRYALRLTGREDAAWDVLQEAWLGIIRGLRKLADPRRFSAWAFRIVTRRAADWIRKHARRRSKQRELGDEHPAPPPTGGDRADTVRAALKRLPDDQRIVLSLYYLDEFSVAEIAAILCIPAGTVKSRLHHARARLKRIWEGENHE